MRKNTILIAEDDAIFRRLVARTLSTQGFEIVEAANGLIALEHFGLSPDVYDLIVSDARMPVMDGAELLRQVRVNSNIPFIIMTGFSEIVDMDLAFRLGANDFVPKPFRIDVLLSAVEKCIGHSKNRVLLRTENEVSSFQEREVDDFLDTEKLPSDLYLKLSENQFVRVGYKGESTPVERLNNYKKQRIEHLYVQVIASNE